MQDKRPQKGQTPPPIPDFSRMEFRGRVGQGRANPGKTAIPGLVFFLWKGDGSGAPEWICSTWWRVGKSYKKIPKKQPGEMIAFTALRCLCLGRPQILGILGVFEDLSQSQPAAGSHQSPHPMEGDERRGGTPSTASFDGFIGNLQFSTFFP